jgi:hypothetical protein
MATATRLFAARTMTFPWSAARLTAWVPWLCAPDSHRVCPYQPAKSAGKPTLHPRGSVYITFSVDERMTVRLTPRIRLSASYDGVRHGSGQHGHPEGGGPLSIGKGL